MKDIPFSLSYDDVLLVPQHSSVGSRSEVDLSTQITPRVRLNLPLISINMTDVTGVRMAIALGKLGGLGFLPRFYSPEKQAEMVSQVKKKGVVVGGAVGCREVSFERAKLLANAGVDILTLDVAQGAMQKAIETTSKLKSLFGKKADIVSGVVATYEGAEALFKAGADCVRIGVGPGTICTTRLETGVGVPQISAVLAGARAARKYKKTILCDGGTKNSGDIVKGLAAGASAVIAGSQFAGTDESPGKLVTKNSKKYKTYNASTSLAEKVRHTKNLKNNSKNYLRHIEGVESFVPYKGPLKDIVIRMKANLQSGFSYCGAKNLNQLWQKSEFIRVSPQGVRESGPHDVIVKFPPE